VRAGLERDEEGRAARARPGGFERRDLGMRTAEAGMPPLAHDLAVAHDERPDDGIRLDAAAAALGERERTEHEPGVGGVGRRSARDAIPDRRHV
jgi:hypothetical protein